MEGESNIEQIPLPSKIHMELHDGKKVCFRCLTLNDLVALTDTLDLPPIELALEVLDHQAEDLQGTVLNDIPRPTLLRLARTWASNPMSFNMDPSGVSSFADFKDIIVGEVEKWERTNQELGEHQARSIAPLKIPAFPPGLTTELGKIETATRRILEMAEQTARISESFAASLRANLPDPRVLAKQLQTAIDEADEGKDYLDRYGYGFAVFGDAIGWVREVAQEKPASRDIHRAFLARTRDPEFRAELLQRVAKSTTLARREHILRSALAAHIERLSPDRNAILHGYKTTYVQAKRSAKLVLLIDALTYVIVSAE